MKDPATERPSRGRSARLAAAPAWLLAASLCVAHGVAIWLGLGGRRGMAGPWPIAVHDHPLYWHSALVTRSFLRMSGTTAGYDPFFMAGYPKSVVFPASSTLPELVLFAFRSHRPAPVYKAYVLVSAGLIPWLFVLAGLLLKVRPWAIAVSVALFLVYVWTDFPINYATFGMLPYLLAIPLGLAATAALTRFLQDGGRVWWSIAAIGSASVVLVHFTSAMVIAPAVVLAEGMSLRDARRAGRPMPWRRHAALWSIPVVVALANAFWWWPGVWLAATKGRSDFAFAHPEPVLVRLGQIFTTEPSIEPVLVVLGLAGMVAWLGRDRSATGLAGFLAAGFGWGYLAGASRVLDFLQPGRHTYAFYTAAALAAGFGIGELASRPRTVRGRITVSAVLVVGAAWSVWAIGPWVAASVRFRLGGPEPFLSSRPTPRLLWIVRQVRTHLRPGERLLYEEGGFGQPGVSDPFAGGRYSGLLPHLTGVEVLGGPYLHASLTTNFTQFGEGMLFGRRRWGRDHFVRFASYYRPSAILCWSPWARAFCRANPDLVEILAERGPLLFGRVVGFPGATVRGEAEVVATPGRLRVRVPTPAPELDGPIVLRYHFAPHLRSRPPVGLEPVHLEGDPVPFIGLRRPKGLMTLELDLSP